MFLPSTKIALVNEISKIGGYTKKEISDIYKGFIDNHPNRNKYYTKRGAIRQLQAIYIKLKKLGKNSKIENI